MAKKIAIKIYYDEMTGEIDKVDLLKIDAEGNMLVASSYTETDIKYKSTGDNIYSFHNYVDYKEAYNAAERIRKKLKKFRQGGLEKGGEYSVENLVFKVLRRNEYLHKLSSLKIMSYDNLMSINGGIDSEIIKVNFKEIN